MGGSGIDFGPCGMVDRVEQLTQLKDGRHINDGGMS
jgi:hypothetical protein